ncbi:hypothetical protein H7I77_13360 [Mycolicibacterium novocastrense]|uniref:3-hydroxybutyryl-CoA dehydrogenase n=1 Tax=Mycolicibacterium novocastrense TaxID=59813 RepID=A0AAW5SJF2_MYCNV|nr:hypothetical protein [Mycolicibacterium novocastrense]MCV7024325.1 hypothetical protein [Mycolicibacterium novocastrense]GAT08059.1 3-hydroxybutyryl-CoA dehydrogenase [Mycolicibacterium novocastrense]
MTTISASSWTSTTAASPSAAFVGDGRVFAVAGERLEYLHDPARGLDPDHAGARERDQRLRLNTGTPNGTCEHPDQTQLRIGLGTMRR